MRFSINSFVGEVPKMEPRLLPDGAAQIARNCDFASGVLEPLRADTSVLSETGVVDFHKHGGTYLTFPRRTDVVPGPVATNRLYIMADGQTPIMKVMPGGTEYDLALPTPTAPPAATIETPAAEGEPVYQLDENDNQVLDAAGNPIVLVEAPALPVTTVIYTYTFVSTLDEESLPAPASYPLDVTEGSTVRLVFPDQAPVASRINRKRVYRSVTSESGETSFFFVKEINDATSVYVHDISVDPPQEPIQSTFYDPPVDGLHGLTAMNNGMMAAFKDKSLYFCEPFIPHAWPETYSLKTDYPIVGLAAFGNALAVLTTGQPYICNGTAPENMIMERLEINAPCLSAASIVDMGYSAFYATNDGIASISTGGAEIITRDLFSRSQWRAMDPSSVSAGHYNGAYVFSYNDGGTTRAGMLRFMDSPFFITTDTEPNALRHDIETGDLFYATSTGVSEFDVEDGSYRSLVWKSKLLDTLGPLPFSVLMIEGDELGSDATDTGFEARIYQDETLFHTITSLNTPERLPAGIARVWEVEIVGKVRVTRAVLAGAVEEIMT